MSRKEERSRSRRGPPVTCPLVDVWSHGRKPDSRLLPASSPLCFRASADKSEQYACAHARRTDRKLNAFAPTSCVESMGFSTHRSHGRSSLSQPRCRLSKKRPPSATRMPTAMVLSRIPNISKK
eukprot:scaffold10537_cov122-Isochrysis_galbana.AAC.23